MPVRIKRVYETPSEADGYRVLVDRLWPRGLSKEAAMLDAWMRTLAPSDGLRRWFGHDPARWEEFRVRYEREIAEPSKQPLMDDLAQRGRSGTVTLLFSARDVERNNAAVLREVLLRIA